MGWKNKFSLSQKKSSCYQLFNMNGSMKSEQLSKAGFGKEMRAVWACRLEFMSPS